MQCAENAHYGTIQGFPSGATGRSSAYSAMNIWIERNKDGSGGCKGYAEIFVSGDRFSYIDRACIGRLYKANLSDEQIEALYNSVAEGCARLN